MNVQQLVQEVSNLRDPQGESAVDCELCTTETEAVIRQFP
jgi:hypothetical protein